MAFDFTSFVAPGLNLVGGLLNAGYQKSMMRYQNEQNKKLLDHQYNQNLAQWNRENEYNLPKNQVARLIDANISPSLAFGSAAASTAASSPQMGFQPVADHQIDSGLQNLGSTFLQSMATSGNLNVAKENTAIAKSNLEVQKMLAQDTHLDSTIRRRYLDESMQLQMKTERLQQQNLDEQIKTTAQRRQFEALQNQELFPFQKAMTAKQYEALCLNTSYITAEAELRLENLKQDVITKHLSHQEQQEQIKLIRDDVERSALRMYKDKYESTVYQHTHNAKGLEYYESHKNAKVSSYVGLFLDAVGTIFDGSLSRMFK